MDFVTNEKPHRSGTENRRRRKRLLVRLDDGEYAEIVAGSEAAGLTLASYARARVLSGPVRKPSHRPPRDAALLTKLLAELGRIGSNLNQVARALNTGDTRDMSDLLSDLTAVLIELRTAANAIKQALGC